MYKDISALDFLVFTAYFLILKFGLTWLTAHFSRDGRTPPPLVSAIGALL